MQFYTPKQTTSTGAIKQTCSMCCLVPAVGDLVVEEIILQVAGFIVSFLGHSRCCLHKSSYALRL